MQPPCHWINDLFPYGAFHVIDSQPARLLTQLPAASLQRKSGLLPTSVIVGSTLEVRTAFLCTTAIPSQHPWWLHDPLVHGGTQVQGLCPLHSLLWHPKCLLSILRPVCLLAIFSLFSGYILFDFACYFFEIGSCNVVQAVLKLTVTLLPQPSEYWD